MCSLEFSDLEASIWQKYKDRGVQVIGLDTGGLNGGDTVAIVEQFREQTGASFPLGFDFQGSYARFRRGGGEAISPFPLDVIIDSQGVVRYVSREYEASAIGAVLDSVLSGPDEKPAK
ncbi:MAG: hypothetical protein MJE77_13795 [Proteobacteria bacterium]|nr:hypothetical protein [Pseudomonadota bacterium]